MYERITDEDPYKVPMRIYPAIHYTMGGLWVDYNLMSTIPGLFVLRRGQLLRPRRQPPGRQRPDAGPGRRLLHPPVHVGDYLANEPPVDGRRRITRPFSEAEATRSRARTKQLARRSTASGRWTPSTASLGKIMWDYCGMARTERACATALEMIPELREEFWRERARARATNGELNQSLEKAGRVADFLELGELICLDALDRTESCGGHFREECQTQDGEALRDDENFSYVAAWDTPATAEHPTLVKEPLDFENVHLASAATSEQATGHRCQVKGMRSHPLSTV